MLLSRNLTLSRKIKIKMYTVLYIVHLNLKIKAEELHSNGLIPIVCMALEKPPNSGVT